MADTALTPIYLPKLKAEDEDAETYETSVVQNEENMNQNFTYLYNRIVGLEGMVSTLQTKSTEGK